MFGFAGVLSPSLWYANRAIFEVAQGAATAHGRIYLDVGTAENRAMVGDARRMRLQLERNGYKSGENLAYVEEQGGRHNEAAWGMRLSGALRFLLAAGAVAPGEREAAGAVQQIA